MVKRHAFVLMFSVLAILSLTSFVMAEDFTLPPPPDANESLLPPPPGGDTGSSTEALPPPPGDNSSASGELPPPPGAEAAPAGNEMPPPPAEGMTGEVPPPPGTEAAPAGELPPPPGGEAAAPAGNELPPPPSGDAAPAIAGELPPPPAEEAPATTGTLPPPPSEEVAAPESKPAEEEPVKVSKHTTKVSSGKLGHYKVAKGDSLWRISGKSKIYNDSFKWPLVYKANKAIIEDPDLIYPKQKFEINQNFNEAEIEDAVSKAKETEAYQPHSEPRKSLPIKY